KTSAPTPSTWEGVTAMPLFTLGLEQIIQWKYGVMGTVGITLLTFGLKAGSPNCACAGALVLALLFMPND
ncbi:hypothetical protein PV405_35315, partial [Streptomyces sp. ME02-6979-3A]